MYIPQDLKNLIYYTLKKLHPRNERGG